MRPPAPDSGGVVAHYAGRSPRNRGLGDAHLSPACGWRVRVRVVLRLQIRVACLLPAEVAGRPDSRPPDAAAECDTLDYLLVDRLQDRREIELRVGAARGRQLRAGSIERAARIGPALTAHRKHCLRYVLEEPVEPGELRRIQLPEIAR